MTKAIFKMSSSAAWRIFSDGGSRGNPGPGASGAVVYNDATIVKRVGKFFPRCTNNHAEYQSVLLGLRAAKSLGVKSARFFMDSQLVVRQINGEYKIKHPDLRLLYLEVQKLLEDFTSVTFHHVPRAQNKEADRVVNEVLDRHL